MNLLDALTSSGWMLHRPVFDRLSALVLGRIGAEGYTPIASDQIESLHTERQNRTEARRRDWIGVVGEAQSSTIGELIDPGQVKNSGPGYFVTEGVAVIPVEGVLARHSSMVNGASTPMGMSYGDIVYAARAAINDARVSAVVLDMNTPGGSAMGVDEAAAAIKELSAIKPIIGYGHQLCASAGYYLAAACSMIAISPDGEIGCIGTVMGTYDVSANYAIRGIKTVVVSSGPMKGAGWEGTPIGADIIAEWQKGVDALANRFFQHVQQSRGMNAAQLSAVNDGRIFLAGESVQLKLADAVMTSAQVIAKAKALGSGNSAGGRGNFGNKEQTMSTTPTPTPTPTPTATSTPTPSPASNTTKLDATAGNSAVAASFEQLEAAFPSDPAHVVASLKGKLTMEQAQTAHAKTLTDKLAAANAKIGELSAQVTSLQSQVTQLSNSQPSDDGKPRLTNGVPPVTTGQSASGGDAASSFKSAVQAKMAEGKLSKAAAMDAVALDPATKATHRAWVAAGCPTID